MCVGKGVRLGKSSWIQGDISRTVIRRFVTGVMQLFYDRSPTTCRRFNLHVGIRSSALCNAKI